MCWYEFTKQHNSIKEALRKVASEVMQELEEAERKAANPAPANRTKMKQQRIMKIAAFYQKRKINSNV